MPVKLLAMDIDGTLLDSQWKLPEANRAAIAEAVDRGIEVLLVTGRRFDFARPVAEELDCELLLIVNNGALIKSLSGETHLRHLLPRATAKMVLEATRAYRTGAAVIFDRPKARQIMLESIDWNDPSRRQYYQRNSEYIGQVASLEACLEDDDPIQVMFTGPFEEVRKALAILQELPAAETYSLAITEYEAKNFSILDVICRNCSKGTTLEEWARRRGIARDEVMAVGDNWNDHDMLEYAGYPVVMGNSIPELKLRGWPVTLSNDEAGLAAAIRTYAFGE
jgi:Cof subfamily protein (haloacid dehalogenase superfamily)